MPSLKLWKYSWKWNTVMHYSPFSPWHGCTQHSSGLLLLWNQPDHQLGRERLLRLLECLTELCYLRYCVLNLKMFYMVWSPSAKAKGQAHHRKSMLMVAYPKTSVFKPIQKKKGMALTIRSQLRSSLGWLSQVAHTGDLSGPATVCGAKDI